MFMIEYDFHLFLDWLSVSHEIFLSLIAIIIGYWGNRIHRAAWIGGLACFQGAACFLIMIPYLEHVKNPNATVIIDSPSNIFYKILF